MMHPNPQPTRTAHLIAQGRTDDPPLRFPAARGLQQHSGRAGALRRSL